MRPEPTWIAVGKIRKPFGLKGEISVEVFGDTADRFRPGQTLHLLLPQGRQRLTVANLRILPGKTLVSFQGIEGLDDVEGWRGRLFEVPAPELPDPEPGDYYYYQLMDLEVRDAEGRRLGTVRDIRSNASRALLTVEGEGRQHLIPFVGAIIDDVDLEAGVITLADVEGLLDL
jgi:16S rRNA processing protein RimM